MSIETEGTEQRMRHALHMELRPQWQGDCPRLLKWLRVVPIQGISDEWFPGSDRNTHWQLPRVSFLFLWIICSYLIMILV